MLIVSGFFVEILLYEIHIISLFLVDNIEEVSQIIDVTEVDTNQFLVCGYTTSGHCIREQLFRGCFFQGLENYLEKNVREMKTKLYSETLMDMDGVDETQKNLWMLFQLCPVRTYCGPWSSGSMEKGEPRFL